MAECPRCGTKASFVHTLFLSALLVGIVVSRTAEPTSSETKLMETPFLYPELFARQDVLEKIVSQVNETRFRWFDAVLVNIGPRPARFFILPNVEAAEFIAKELNTTESMSVTYQWFTFEGEKIANVIGVLPSANPDSQSKIVVGAHFDTVPNSPGADDNGSGTALLLEVARVLSQFQFNCTIEFVAFNAEEDGLFGSKYYVQQASQADEDILLMINIDMILWDNPTSSPNEKLWIVYNGLDPYEEGERFADAALNISYTYTTAPIKKRSFGGGFSDHSSFWSVGLPALMITENQDDFPNPYYHTSNDSMSAEGYNFTLGAQAAQVVAATVAKLAGVRTHVLTVNSSPSGVTFAVNGESQATPWSETYNEGEDASVSLEMPETHDGYVWSHWIPDGDTNRTKTVTADTDISLTAVFTQDTVPPGISIASPENKTYHADGVPLTFTVSESASWIGYSLDGQANVTITGDQTLSALSDGSHSLIIYANDTAGNSGASEMVHFSIETEKAEPFPTLTVASIVTIAIVGAVVLVYFMKFKK